MFLPKRAPSLCNCKQRGWDLFLLRLNLPKNKKVLLRERKRHTARRVGSTHSVVLSWLTPPPPPRQLDLSPPPGWTWPTPPQAGPDSPPQAAGPDPPWQLDLTPPGQLDLTPPPSWTWPPPVDRQICGWMEGQTRVKTLPSLILRTRAVITHRGRAQ